MPHTQDLVRRRNILENVESYNRTGARMHLSLRASMAALAASSRVYVTKPQPEQARAKCGRARKAETKCAGKVGAREERTHARSGLARKRGACEKLAHKGRVEWRHTVALCMSKLQQQHS
eukprot:6174998-Pleurochrysis_carterae.AAC.1